MNEGYIDHQVAFPSEVDVSHLQVALFGAAAASDVVASASGGVAAAPAHGVEGRKNVLVCIFGAVLCVESE